MGRLWVGVLLLIGTMLSAAFAREPVRHARVDRSVAVYDVNPDLTFTRTETRDTTLFTDRALRQLDRAFDTFYPDKQSLEVVEAWVDQPDGTRDPVEKTSIFTRPSAASQSAPGFVNSLTTTVLFPRLTHGSRTHIVWRFTQKTPPLLGFNAENVIPFDTDVGLDETRIDIPSTVPLVWRARGGFVVDDETKDGIRHLDAHIDAVRGREQEPAMVSNEDFMPLFLATTLPSAEAVGAIVYRESEGRATVTPEIAALSARIAGGRTGLDAARAIHAWVAEHIRYVAVYLNPDDGWIPHTASEVLKAGYGDCKDYVVLMQALLAASGIEARAAMIDWGTRYADLPLWLPFFNHEIVWLPAYDHYLNPTDGNASFDALDRRLSGKQVVIVTRDGLVRRTPAATPAANRYRYFAQVNLDMDGTIDGTARYAMTPNAEIHVRNWLATASSYSDLARQVLAFTPEGGFGEFEASDPQDIGIPLALAGPWHSPHAVNTQDGETFLRVPSGLDVYPPYRDRHKLSPDGRRETPVIADATDKRWETTIVLPSGMDIRRMPPDVDVETRAGHYTARYVRDEGTIVATRRLIIEREIVQPDDYPALEQLVYALLVDNRALILLTKSP